MPKQKKLVSELNMALKTAQTYCDEEVEDLNEIDDDTLDDGTGFEEKENEFLGNSVFSLATQPISKWGEIRVSPDSFFCEDTWSFEAYPHIDRKSVTAHFVGASKSGVDLSLPENRHLLLINKALLFYTIPHFTYSRSIRSYTGIGSKRARMARFVGMLEHFGLYRDDSTGLPAGTFDELEKGDVIRYINELPHKATRWAIAHTIGYWQSLSQAKLLPTCYSIFTEFLTKSEISKYRRDYDDSSQGYLPLPLDDYVALFNASRDIIVNYGADIMWLARTYYPSVRKQGKNYVLQEGESTSSVNGVALFKAYKPFCINGEPWWSLAPSRRSHYRDKGEFISFTDVTMHVAMLFDAAVTMIFATTGLRRSEVNLLTADCIEHNAEGYWLNYTVVKTSHASQGDNKRIPVPEITALAVFALRELCMPSRLFGGHGYLLSTFIRPQFFGNRPHIVFADRSLKRISDLIGLESAAHSHQFRKSLAMYIIYQDSSNIDVISHLFSHKSLRMTLRYIISLPGVAVELKNQLIGQNIDILEEVIEAATNGRIGGVGGVRVRDAIKKAKNFASRLHDDGKEGLEQYVESLLDEGVYLLHRSSLAICLKTSASFEASPCNGKNEEYSNKLHPNTWNCVPFSCSHAAFTSTHEDSLVSEITFHRNMLKKPYSGVVQRQFSETRIVDCRKRLREIRGETKPC